MADIDDKLQAALKLAKKQPMNFAFVGKGGSQGKLVVSKKPIPSKDVAAAKKEVGGGVVFRGRCVGEEGKLVFETAKEPPMTLGKQLKTIIKENAGLILNVETRVAADLVEDEGEPAQTQAEQGGVAPTVAAGAPPSAAAAAEAKADVTKRLAALTASFKEAVAQKGSAAAQSMALMATLKGLIVKKQFAEAAKVLDELEPLVAKFKTQQAGYKVHKGEVEAALAKAEGWVKDAGKYKTAVQAADKLEKTNVAEALAGLDKARSEAEAEAKVAEKEYQELKKSVTAKADLLRNPKIHDHVKADLDALPKLADADAKVQANKGAEGKKILQDLVAPYTQAVASVKGYREVLVKKDETDKKIAELEKLPHKANVAPEIAVSKQKVTNALKLADPPARDYAGAKAALVGVDAACVEIKKMTEDYQKVLNVKADTDKKIARLEKHPKKALITAEIADVKVKAAAALALADPPNQRYMPAINALNAVDKLCAAAEVKILDEAVKGMDRGDMHDLMEKTFKDRFGIELKMKDKGESPTDAYMAVRRVYELMALVPDTHTIKNPSLKKVERVGGDAGTSYYESETDIFLGLGTKNSKKVVLKCTRPRTDGTALQGGLANTSGVVDPPVEADCQPRPGVSKTQSYFDWTTLHEIGHAIDDKQGFMKKNAGIAGWAEHGSSCSAAAQAVADHFNFKTKEALAYIRDMLEGKPGKRPSDKPPAPTGRADWNTVRGNVETYCDSIRVGKKPWDNLPASIGDRVYHEAYEKNWVSYVRAKRSQAISGYQFRAPGEWFSELYAAYNSGVLKDSHPMVTKFLRDL